MKRLMDKPQQMAIKWRLAAVMADREIDYKQLAAMTSLHPVTVNKHKNMKRMPPRLEDTTLNSYCQALNCQPGDLLVYLPDSEGVSGVDPPLA